MTVSRKENNKKIALIIVAIMAAAGFMGVMQTAFAQNSGEQTSVNAVSEEVSAEKAVSGGEGIERVIAGTENWGEEHNINPVQFLKNIGKSTGFYKMFLQSKEEAEAEALAKEEAEKAASKANNTDWGTAPGWQSFIMMAVGFLIVYLGAAKGFEPLLLIPIGFGTILINAVGAGMGNLPDGMLAIIYKAGVGNEFFPMLIFMGIGAMTDFGPLIANPKTALLGGAAQFGVFFTLFGVAVMNIFGLNYNILQACAIAIIGGADGPTSIYVSGKLAPELMAVIAVAA
ncbi:MAG: sodium ion-translocating decarboxylase subunit beta, partial [Spirochaetales bacterium]|nr:sodium ion-translocating decarboxylase subunit beta [Spirochaetales bacterium]